MTSKNIAWHTKNPAFMNVLINNQHEFEELIALNGTIDISSSDLLRFLGIYIDNHLNSFSTCCTNRNYFCYVNSKFWVWILMACSNITVPISAHLWRRSCLFFFKERDVKHFWICLHFMILFLNISSKKWQYISLTFKRLPKNFSRKSSNCNTIVRPKICKSHRRDKSLFPLSFYVLISTIVYINNLLSQSFIYLCG